MRCWLKWSSWHFKTSFSVFCFSKSFRTWFWHTDVKNKKTLLILSVLSWSQSWSRLIWNSYENRFSYINSYNDVINVYFCLQASAWYRFFFFFWSYCLSYIIILSKLKFTMYRETIYCCSLQGQRKSAFICRPLTATESENQVTWSAINKFSQFFHSCCWCTSFQQVSLALQYLVSVFMTSSPR